MVEAKPGKKLTEKRSIVKAAGIFILNHAHLLMQTALKNKSLAPIVAAHLDEGLNIWMQLSPDLHPAKLYPIVHVMSLMRNSIYNVFHNSVLSSILDGSHDIELLA